jgi:hypothetical protein
MIAWTIYKNRDMSICIRSIDYHIKRDHKNYDKILQFISENKETSDKDKEYLLGLIVNNFYFNEPEDDMC